jgi:hypothetical protein
MTRRMLCSGTGGPRKTGVHVLTCPVCLRDFNGYHATRLVVPRHFVRCGATLTAAPGAATAVSATGPEAYVTASQA